MIDNIQKYSVLMSVYAKDSPEYLRTSILSMVNQTVPPDEIILVEDGPLTGELLEVIEEIQNERSLLKTVPLSKNGGLGRALNFGLAACSNELIARMDSDDISDPVRCEKQLEKFAENPNLTILGTQINEFLGEPSNIVSSRTVPISFEEIEKFAHRRSPFNHPTVMYKKSKVLEYGGYGQYGRKEDLDLFLRMVFGGCYSENLSEALLLYRTDENNLKRRKSWVNCSEYISVMGKFFKKGNIQISDMTYVSLGQMLMYLTPESVTEKLSSKFLRSGK